MKNSLASSLLGYLPQIIVLFVAIVGFYYTTRISIANNTQDVKENKQVIEKVQTKLNEHEKNDFTKPDMLELKGELIRELTNTQQQLQATNNRLDQVILYFKQEKQ